MTGYHGGLPKMNKYTKLTASNLISQLKLERHIEGGYFRRVYESKYKMPIAGGEPCERLLATAIYFLLDGHDFSAFHRLKSDEIWIYNCGSPLTLSIIDKDGELKQKTLGDPENPIYQLTVDANQWFAADINDKSSFTLMSCFLAPGFDYHDFELADRQRLLNEYPMHADLIHRLTREASHCY